MANVDILQLLFNNFLRINPSIIYKYSTPQTQLLNLFLIPHIILFLFIYGFAWVITPTHKGFRYLVSIATYLFMIIMGEPYSYYSTFLPFLLLWWQIALFIGVVFFVWGRIIHPSKVPELFALGKATAERVTKKGKEREAIEEEINSIKKQIAVLQGEASNPGIQPAAQAYIQSQIGNLKAKQKDLESRL